MDNVIRDVTADLQAILPSSPCLTGVSSYQKHSKNAGLLKMSYG
jgi:hypothetical protein